MGRWWWPSGPEHRAAADAATMTSRTPPARLLPDPAQHELLAETLARVNRAANAARTRALGLGVIASGSERDLRAVVREELERLKLPPALTAPVAERIRATGGRTRFGTYQSVVLPPSAVRWPAADRVTLPTVAGRRTIPVYVDPRRGDLRPPLAGRPVLLVYQNDEFTLRAADEPRPVEDGG
jgi:hypothetical protein